MTPAPNEGSRGFDPTAPLTPSGNLRRRQFVSRLLQGTSTAAALAAVAVLVIVVYAVADRGARAISWEFLTTGTPTGIGPALVGSGVIVGIATAIAMPLGILIALFLTEYGGRRGTRALQLTMDLMNGLPSILIGLFVYFALTIGASPKAYFASLALAIIEVPLIARGTQEVLNLVPTPQREAADALGVARWRSVLTIILPSALGGILTATVLSVARAAGETAPLLLITGVFDGSAFSLNPGEALPNVPVRIYQLSEAQNPEGFTEAWGLSLVLIVFILVASLSARTLLNRSKRKLSSE